MSDCLIVRRGGGIDGVEKDVWSTGATAPASVSRYTSQLYNGKIYCPQDNGTAMHIYSALAFTA